MQLADAAGGQAHIDAGDLLGNGEIGNCDLARPSAILDAFRRVVEGRPRCRHVADIGGRGRLRGRKLIAQSLTLRARIAEVSRAFRVDGALGRLIRIAEGRRLRAGADHGGTRRQGQQFAS